MTTRSLDEQLRIIEDFENLTGVTIDTSHPWSLMAGPGMLASRCVLVMGVTRSGTSAVAGCLHFLGVRMCPNRLVGDVNPFGTFEDVDFLNARPVLQDEEGNARWNFTADSIRQYMRLIRDRNAEHAVWGVKSAAVMFLYPALRPVFEDPRIVVVERDMEAVRASFAKWKEKMGTPDVDTQRPALGLVMEMARREKMPMLTVRYDDLLADPEGQVRELGRFAFEGTGLTVAELEHVRAVRHVRPELRHF